jgi:poly(A) polymerase
LVEPKIYKATDHDIDPSLIDPDALQILSRLRHAGFTAYLVGGSVRDLLAKKRPKDFDISTSALPEQVKLLFRRNCILIGRRFRLAHVRFGKKIFEVATFRAGDPTDSGLIVQDNLWGTPEEDALRRDFTINGLFYDPENHQIIDYVGGWNDIHKKILRTIGDPRLRFRQDPVRMIRLLKFRARFDFHIESDTLNALVESKEEIIKSSSARILEEMLRMMESGAAASFFQLMLEYGLLEFLFPPLARYLRGPHSENIYHYLTSADQVHQAKGPASLDRSVVVASLIYPLLEDELKRYEAENGAPHLGQITQLASSLIKEVIISSFTHFPRRISSNAIFILTMQYRLTPLTGKRIYRNKIMHNRDFPLALQMLQLRALVDSSVFEAYAGWKKAYRSQEHHGDRHPHTRPHHSFRKEPRYEK